MMVLVSMPRSLAHDAHRREEDDVADARGERGDAVVLGQPDRHADGEEQRQVREDRVARLRHHAARRSPAASEKLAAADAQQDAGHRQHRDRQHHATCRSSGGSANAFLNDGYQVLLSLSLIRIGIRRTAPAARGLAPPSAAPALPRRGLAFVEASLRICALIAGDRGHADAQLIHADPDQDRHRAADRCAMPPHTPTHLPCRVRALAPSARSAAAPPGAAHRPAAPAWDARGPSPACIGSGRWCRWRRSRPRARRLLGHDAAAGTSTMMPTLTAGTPSRGLLLGQDRLGGAQLVQRRDHREHDVQIGQMAPRAGSRGAACGTSRAGRGPPGRRARRGTGFPPWESAGRTAACRRRHRACGSRAVGRGRALRRRRR